MSFNEVIRMALGALRTNKLRSILTMTGVAIGVFSVIGVMTALSVISSNIESGISFLGSNLFQFAKYPIIQKDDTNTFQNRRNITFEQAMEYKRLMEGDGAVSLKVFDRGGKAVGFGRRKVQGKQLVGGNENFLLSNTFTLAYGRNITPEDVDLARNVTVVGADIPKGLFPSENPIGKVVQVDNKPYRIIGVM